MDCLGLLQQRWREGEPAVFFDGGVSDPALAAGASPASLRRWSFLALRPSASLCVRVGEDVTEAWWREEDGDWRSLDVPATDAAGQSGAWQLLRRLCVPGSGVPGIPFPYGVAGLVTYDAGRLVERLPSLASDDAVLPALLFHRFDAGWSQRSGEEAVLHVAPGGREPAPAATPSERSAVVGSVAPEMTPKDFEAMVVRARGFVQEGDVFQVNLSHRLACDVAGSPLALYERLRQVNPAPFSAFFSSGPLPWDREGFCVLSSSPERLFSLHGRTLEARPIAGTRRRDPDPARDAALKAELRADPKEQAEHVMLVDLARNDLGRVARFGSVRVPDLLTVETYRTVHHLVSVVDAELAPGKDAIDALVALFPGGTITGAPKVRAMEIIEELEPVRRGIYTGSLGWISPEGDCDFNILIRSILVQHGRAHLQVGAGIVEESDPRREYEETLAKAKGLLLALGRDDA